MNSILVHDVIKIKYVTEGYITKNYPPHLISDLEMMEGFLSLSDDYDDNVDEDDPIPSYMTDYMSGFYIDNYVQPMLKQFESTDIDEMTDDEYDVFMSMWDIAMYILERYDEIYAGVEEGTVDTNLAEIFDAWIYSYMLGEVIGPESEDADKHDVFVLLDMDNLYDVFTVEIAKECLNVSTKWLKKSTETSRPAGCFAEPHVIKSLRLDNIL